MNLSVGKVLVYAKFMKYVSMVAGILTVMPYMSRVLTLMGQSPPPSRLGTKQFSSMAQATWQARQQGQNRPRAPVQQAENK